MVKKNNNKKNSAHSSLRTNEVEKMSILDLNYTRLGQNRLKMDLPKSECTKTKGSLNAGLGF